MKIVVMWMGMLLFGQVALAADVLKCQGSNDYQLEVEIATDLEKSRVTLGHLGQYDSFSLSTFAVNRTPEKMTYLLELLSAKGAMADLNIEKTYYLNRSGIQQELIAAKLIHNAQEFSFYCSF